MIVAPTDLVDGDWHLAPELVDGDALAVEDDATEIALAVESSDDESFEVELWWTDASGTPRAVVDSAISGDLASTSPGGGNHYVYAVEPVAGDHLNLKIEDTGGGDRNEIEGSIHVH